MEFWVLLLTLWAFVRWLQIRHWRKNEDERFARVIDALNHGQAKIESLEKRVHDLEHSGGVSASPPPTAQTPEPVRTPTSPPKPIAPSTESPQPPVPITPPEAVRLPEPVKLPPPAPTPAPVQVPQPAIPRQHTTGPSTPPATPPPSRPSPPPLMPPPKFAHASPRQIGAEFEQKLGGNWLNKIGITILVIGISLFLAIKFPSLANPQKILIGYVVSLGILGGGVYLEKLDRYRIFARALIGGGWALTFFTTYAMHFVPYTRVIDTQSVDLVLLFIVATVMVVHTLRYDSQVVTGLAFLLAFTTVTISQNTIYSLSAGVILAVGLVAIVHRRGWFELEVFGVLASYLNHFVWLTRMVIPFSGLHRMFPEFIPSCVLLCLYWAVYRWSYVARRIQRESQETISTVAAILNTSLLLLLFKYQSVHPEWAFYALLVLGAAELAIAHLPV